MSTDARSAGTDAETASEQGAAPNEEDFLVVGVGASAGGLDAIERLFDNTPPQDGMAYVIVQHLSPNFESLMDQLLSRHTQMPIHRVEDGIRVEPNHIYLIPPRKNMVLREGLLRLTDQEPRGQLNLPIDVFFNSLAEDVGQRAIAIILSGTGSDGSRGIKQVHDAGGLVLAQDLDTASFDGMPRSATLTEMVDVVCPPEMMHERIMEYRSSPETFPRGVNLQPAFCENPGDLGELFRLFRHRFGLDFSHYKSATIDRRIERRMQFAHAKDLKEYIERLEGDAEELEHLFRDLLIEVTQFFRDPEAFEIISRDVAPRIVDEAEEGSEIRVWVSGCATGEEAYSHAILFLNAIEASGKEISVKVFATDVHRRSLEYASAGVYPSGAVESLPRKTREKYFTANGELFHTSRELRQAVIFAPNDITKDPPFTKIDLISCRNLLIYLDASVQQRVLSQFHFGLKVGGVLFLGPSETLGSLGNEFDTIDRHWRVYQKRREVRLPLATRLPMAPALSNVVSGRAPIVVKSPIADQGHSRTTVFEDLLGKYVPPSLLVNEYFELVHSFGEARQLLIQPEGKPTLDVLKMVDGDLRMALSTALYKARESQTPVVYNGVHVDKEHEEKVCKVVVEPYTKGGAQMYLICIEPTRSEVSQAPAPEEFDVREQSSERITALEQELAYTRESLQSTVEELETSNEELQSTNEELIASNEELQSTNEELQSVNEELYTVNAEHKEKIDELTQLTNDMDNLLKSTEIGTVFLDRELCIRMFTPAISSAFNMLEQDIGRPIDHIAYRLSHADMTGDIRSVLAGGESIEREVHSESGQTYLQRVRPYCGEGNRTEGVVLTFTDVSAVKEVERAREYSGELTRIYQDLQAFAYAVSHDMQAPIRHARIGVSEMAGFVRDAHDVELMRHWNQIKDSTDLLSEMLQGLLSYSRVSTRGKEFSAVDCNEILESTLENLEPSIQASGLAVTSAELPPVLADRTQIERVFHELIDNAINYREESRPATLSVKADRKNGEWIISFRDNGVGIEKRHYGRVFTVFQRLGYKPEAPGKGLGLALSKRIVERHGGKIWVESTPGEGSTFRFTLRAVAGQPPQESEA